MFRLRVLGQGKRRVGAREAMSVDIPNYRVVEKLGEGAQTRIYRARCMRTAQDYAIKIVKVRKPEDISFVDLLRTEHTIGAAIDDTIIRKVYELRIMRQRLRIRGGILFMEYIDGITMADREFRCSLVELLSFLGEVATGLHSMHQAGFVHADLKPNNIMVTPDNNIKLIDLGQSSRIREAKARVQGTIDYMAPEQAKKGILLDERTDVFGLGAVLHKLATGKSVSTEMNTKVTMFSQGLAGKRIDRTEGASKPIPVCVARLIEDCIKDNPDERISDMPRLNERLQMARTILVKQGAGGASTPSAERHVDHEEATHEDLAETILEDLGLDGDRDDSVDLEEELL